MITTVFWLVISIMANKLGTAAALAQQCKTGPAALIFLHGLGDTPAGWSSLQQQLPQLRPRLKDVRYVFPPAPTTQITINGGMSMPGWFDLYDWPIGVDARDDRNGILSSVSQIEEQVAILEKDGIPKSRIVLGGFSQGGAVALLAAYRSSKEAYAGCVCLSAWLTLAGDLSVEAGAKATPLFWGHGAYDDKVLFEQQAFGVEKLKSQGVDVSASNYPVGHSADPEEIQAMADFIDKVLYEK
jgi:lysophospholipase-2